VFVGIRPLVTNPDGDKNTAALSRDHSLFVSKGNLVTICGGKWTTYRKMAEDTVNKAAEIAGLDSRKCNTRDLHVHGYSENGSGDVRLGVYGSDAAAIKQMESEDSALAERIHPKLPVTRAQVVWAARNEMARTVEDVLSRRTRALLLGAKASAEAAPLVAEILSAETGKDQAWQQAQVAEFQKLAEQYQL
jgi:glycerol-3-phosphate dehydrogenase